MNTYFVVMNVHGDFCYISKDEQKCHNYKSSTSQVRSYTAPDEWEMFTKRGNQSIAKKAEKFLEKATDGKTPIEKAARTFLKGYVRLRKTRTMNEAGDTAVRESVWCFLKRFENLIGYYSLNSIWEDEVR